MVGLVRFAFGLAVGALVGSLTMAVGGPPWAGFLGMAFVTVQFLHWTERP